MDLTPLAFLAYVAALAATPTLFGKLKKAYQKRQYPLLYTKIGKYEFNELYETLKYEYYPADLRSLLLWDEKVRAFYSEDLDESDETYELVQSLQGEPIIKSLITLFVDNYHTLKAGIGLNDQINDYQYAYNYLIPRLQGFGLIHTQEEENKNWPGGKSNLYFTSEAGDLFYDCLSTYYKLETTRYKRRFSPFIGTTMDKQESPG